MAFNATNAAFHDDLYAGTDFSSLNWLEQQWVWWYVTIGNPVIATGLMSFLLHEVSFLLAILLLTLNAVCLRSDCLLWTKHSLDYHRLYPLLPQMEATAHQGPYSCRTMGMYQGRSLFALYYRTPSS